MHVVLKTRHVNPNIHVRRFIVHVRSPNLSATRPQLLSLRGATTYTQGEKQPVLVTNRISTGQHKQPVLLHVATSTGQLRDQYWSELVLRTVLYYKHLQMEYPPRVRAMRAHDIYSGRTTRAPLTLCYRCSRSTPARSQGLVSEMKPRFSASYHGCLLQMS